MSTSTDSPWGRHPRIQLLTVGELPDGKGIDYRRTAGVNKTIKAAARATKKGGGQHGLFEAT